MMLKGFKQSDELVTNNVVQVAVPGNQLLNIDQVQVRENYCTEELQRDLDKGWHIIACCPQPTRRPDYILGRKRPIEDS